ncbi:T9SS type A sorting domain-containing protein [Thalassobellus suaedae]|nr:T9SS type A sorting domain-containing protein [Flavobacteriaceae bacterium HL-DH14]
MTLITGNEYFPGGLGEFIAKKDDFLVFEKGPSTDVILQWATYRDASDQCSLSRIWGGIHPPADDIPGRKIGEKIGQNDFYFANDYFKGKLTNNNLQNIVYPNPIKKSLDEFSITNTKLSDEFNLFDINGRHIVLLDKFYSESTRITTFKFPKTMSSGIYLLKINNITKKLVLDN